MAIVRVCDLCGKQPATNRLHVEVESDVFMHTVSVSFSRGADDTPIDVCAACASSSLRFAAENLEVPATPAVGLDGE